MLAKDRFLKKFSFAILIILCLFLSKQAQSEDIKSNLLKYNIELKNTSAEFIQTDGKTIEEGIIYIGNERIKIDYKKPQEITIILSPKKSMYTNHQLRETQFFNTNNSFVGVFLKIISGYEFFSDSNIEAQNDRIVIKYDFELENTLFQTELVYENKPLDLRKIKIKENDNILEMGFFNHTISNKPKEFFSLINPYL